MTSTYDHCYSCSVTRAQVSRPVDLVVPISLALEHGQLHHILRGYKDPAARRLTSAQAHLFQLIVAATVARFLRGHEQHVLRASGNQSPITAIVPIPSSRGRPGNPPLFAALSRVPALVPRLRLALASNQGVQHLNASDNGFSVVDRAVRGCRVLVIDDTFTSGAAVQSAASALSIAGADVVAAVVVGRYVVLSQEHGPSNDWWTRHRASHPFSFANCCLE